MDVLSVIPLLKSHHNLHIKEEADHHSSVRSTRGRKGLSGFGANAQVLTETGPVPSATSLTSSAPTAALQGESQSVVPGPGLISRSARAAVSGCVEAGLCPSPATVPLPGSHCQVRRTEPHIVSFILS